MTATNNILAGIDLTELVERRHPEYAELFDHWNFCEISMRGGRKWFDFKTADQTNLFQFYKEGKNEFKSRKGRAHRANHTKRVVDAINQFLFRSDPVRDSSTPDAIQDFWKNTALGERKPIDRFMRDLDSWLSVFGRMYVVIDRVPQIVDEARDEDSPYAYFVFPQRVLDMAYGENGKLDWIMIEEDFRDDKIGGSGDMEVRWRLWNREAWFLIEEINPNRKGRKSKREFAVVESDDHNLGIVPVIPVDDQEGSRWSAPALIDDIAYMDRAIVNYASLLDEILYEQTFSMLTIPAEAMSAGATEKGMMVEAAKNRIFTYNSTSPGAKPEFISPDAAQGTLIITAIENLKKDIYACTGTDNDANSQSVSKGKEYASGVVRQFDHTQIENILLDKARALEDAEDRIMELVLAWMGKDEQDIDEGWVQYPDKFDVRDLATEFVLASEMQEIEVPMEIMRRQVKQITGKSFPRMTEKDKKEFDAIIDEWMPGYVQDRQINELEVEAKIFVAETQADAMDRDGVTGNNQFGDPERHDLKRDNTDVPEKPNKLPKRSVRRRQVGDLTKAI
jgi:hypothetical protein